jgi:hypothetical protein
MNKRKGNEFVMEKLDRAFANTDWFESYPDFLVTNLPIIGSDHGPIILDTDPPTPFKFRPTPFKFRPFRFNGCGPLTQIALLL